MSTPSIASPAVPPVTVSTPCVDPALVGPFLTPPSGASPRAAVLRKPTRWPMSYPKSSSMVRCGKLTFAIRRKGTTNSWEFFTFRCGSWRCDYCRNWKAKKDLSKIEAGLRAVAGSWRIVRLSRPSRPWGNDYDEASRDFHHLHKGLRKAGAAGIYLAVVSMTPSGLRLSLVADSLPPRSRLIRLASLAGFCADRVRTVSVAGVLSALKPELRDRQRLPLSADLRFRRMKTSRGLFIKRPPSTFEVRLLKAEFSAVRRAELKAQSCRIPFDIGQFPTVKR